jgi:hypothetical protein
VFIAVPAKAADAEMTFQVLVNQLRQMTDGGMDIYLTVAAFEV